MADDVAFFESRIRPVLVKHCYACHSSEADEVKGGLFLDSAEATLQGGDSGPALSKGNANESLLMEALRYEGLEMPPSGRLADTIIRDFERWIQRGAVDPRTKPAPSVTSPENIDIDAGREYWAFRPILCSSTPETHDSAWPATDVDAFILAKLEAHAMRPAPDTDKRTLVRRLYFDIIGLPPTPEQVEAFVQDTTDGALENLVDALLDSPQFGVRWGRHWLDVARYADSNGGDFNATFHDAWRYRDYVIDTFNQDKPFDQFVREQVAGDLLPFESPEERTEQIVATGFLMLGAKMLSERDKEKMTMDVVDEQINTVGQAFLGLTLGCARCHDHKFDPIPTADYYALAGIFRSTRTLEGESQKYVSTWPRRDLPANQEHIDAVDEHEERVSSLDGQIKAAKKKQDELEKQLTEISEQIIGIDDAANDDNSEVAGAEFTSLPPREVREERAGKVAASPSPGLRAGLSLRESEVRHVGTHRVSLLGEKDRIQSELDELLSTIKEWESQLKKLKADAPPPLPKAIAVAEAQDIGDCAIRIRGEHANLGPTVPRGFLQVASSELPNGCASTESGRRELAEWLANRRNPLTARVIVNRVWHHLLGAGLVASVDNFGKLGEGPSHPELLDRLAYDFMQDDWSIKRLIRRIAISRIYGLSSSINSAYVERDPDNRLLWRANRKRLSAEAIRDAMLAVSGKIILSPAGPPTEGLGTIAPQNMEFKQKKFKYYRAAYLPMVRSSLPPMLLLFDFADPDLVTGRRSVTNVPAQSLFLLNSPLIRECAHNTVAAITREVGDVSDVEFVHEIYQRVYSRSPTDQESIRALQFLHEVVESKIVKDEPTALVSLVHTLLASTEFRMLD